MSEFKLTADIREVQRLGEQFAEAAEVGHRRVTERGEQLVREEAPAVTRNLKQGVSSSVGRYGKLLRGEVVATARSGRRGQRKATLHLASGKTKQVTLRPVPAFNYAEAVATGTGVYGPNKASIRPKSGKALLIPVSSAPATIDGKPATYIEVDGQIYVVRGSMKGRRPNPYDQRAARRLGQEVTPIFDRALKDFVGGKP